MLAALVGTALAIQTAPAAPKLVVVISIDQCRRDYITRYAKYYLPARSGKKVGGFNWLMKEGAHFVNAAFSHVPTYTGPGHAVIGTGSSPSLNGIVDNTWLDRSTGKMKYCVNDPGSRDVLTGKESASPKTLWSTTFNDELKMATNGKSKAVSLAIKDRAAILMIGHKADACLWYDKDTGNWTSSDYYCKGGKLPAWTEQLNKDRLIDQWAGRKWETTLPKEALEQCIPAKINGASALFGKQFPHTIGDPKAGKAYYDLITFAPFANEFVFQSAVRAIDGEGLGQDRIPDVLTINLSTNDYMGHAFGAHAPETMEMTVATDKAMSAFFNELDSRIGLKNVMIAVTADHGVCPLPEELVEWGMPGGRVKESVITEPVKAAVTAKYGDTSIIYPAGYQDNGIYLNREVLKQKGIELGDAQESVRQALLGIPQVYRAFRGVDVDRGLITPDALGKMISGSYDRDRCADVVFYLKPGFLYGNATAGTSHGTPWAYDLDVPLLIWGPVRKGVRYEHAGPQDIAPTVARALGIGNTSGNVGRALD